MLGARFKFAVMLLTNETRGEGACVVFLHGLFGSAANWRSVTRTLSAGYQTVALDLRGHGRSAAAGFASIAEMADDVAETLAALGLTAPILVGHSLGARVAMQLAISRALGVRGLVIVDMSNRRYNSGSEAVLAAMTAFDPAAFDRRSDASRALGEALGDATVGAFLATNLERVGGGFAWRLDLPGLAKVLPGYAAALAEGAYKGPSLLVRGEHSSFVLDQDLDDLRVQFPELRAETVAGAGHWVHSEQPVVFTDLVQSFLASLSS